MLHKIGALTSAPMIVLTLLLVTACSGPSESRAASAGADALTGAWRARLQFSDGALAKVTDLEFLYVFNQGGTMTESSNYDGAPPVPPAYGVWRATGPNQFEATYVYFNSKAPAHLDELIQGGGWLPAGRGVITERLTLALDGQSFDSSMVLDLVDQAGVHADGGGHATGHGTRIRF